MAVTNITLNGIQIPCDPDQLNFGGRRRGSVHRTIDGGVVVQDRGISNGDQTIQIQGRLFNTTLVQALYALYRQTGNTFTYQDFKGNSVTVCFTPGIESLRVAPIKGSNVGYTYEIFLTVVSGTVFTQ